MFSKKHYEFVADVLSKTKDGRLTGDQIEFFERMMLDFSSAFKRDNPNFDQHRFMRAATK